MVESGKTYNIAVDSGGTFTDCVVVDNEGKITTSKAHSTPHDFSEGVIHSVEGAAQILGMGLEQILERTRYFFAHGSTVAVNALLTRSGVKTGLFTTRGFEDTIVIGRVEQKVAGLSEWERFQVYRHNKAEPIVPRPLIKGITERVDYEGEIIVPLNAEELKPALEELVQEGVESIAVCLLWSFMNPRHEREIKEYIHAHYPELFVTISSELIPVLRDYERMATTAMNAYLSPITSRYLSALRTKLRDRGLSKSLLVMQNIGGMIDVGEAGNVGVNLLASGPVGGVLGSKILGEQKGYKNIITTDVGGTSFDVSLIVAGKMMLSSAPVFSQYTLLTPVIDIVSLGAGGGSIARVEEKSGLLKVGPQSAGAYPGPVCYDRGGKEPTFTDANLVLGRIDPHNFLGGRMILDEAKAREAIEQRIARPLGMKVEEAAMGIIQILTSHMADLVRKTTIDNGYDPSDFVLFSFGGAGPLCCCIFAPLIAGIRTLIIPAANSVFSAFGMAGSDIVQVVRHSEPMLAPFHPQRLSALFREMEEKLLEGLSKNNVPRKEMDLVRSMDLRYWGQVHEITVSVPPGVLTEKEAKGLVKQFVERYEDKYGRGTSYGMAQVEAVTLEVKGTGSLKSPALIHYPFTSTDPAAAMRGRRPVWFDNGVGYQPTDIYTREALQAGNRVSGPAVIEAVDTTVLLNPGQEIGVDEYLNLVMEL
jgi:N-methylhydantoinase A